MRRVKDDPDILQAIRQDPQLADLLAQVCEFDLARGEHGEPVRLSSGQPLEGVAGDFAGGTFFLCGAPQSTRPVLYASSEGQAGLIGRSLTEALQIMVGLPSWWDCLKFAGGGDLTVMEATAAHLKRDQLKDQPEIADQRTQVATALSLDTATLPVLLSRLRDAVASTAPEFVLIGPEGDEYDSLFGDWLAKQNPSWK